MFLVLPATVGLVLLASPIISLLYEGIDALDRIATAGRCKRMVTACCFTQV